MAGDDLQLSATLDVSQIEQALQRIVVRTEQMVKASDDRIKQMGQSFDSIIKTGQELIKQLDTMSESQLSPEQRKSFDDFKKAVQQTANSLDVLDKQLRDIQEIHINYGDNIRITIPRNVLRDAIDRDIAEINGEVLKAKLAEIMIKAEGEVKARAAEIRADLVNVLNDPAISGADLGKEVDKLTGKWEKVEAQAIKAAQAQRQAGTPAREYQEFQARAQELDSTLTRLADRGIQGVSDRAAELRRQLRAAMDDNITPTNKLTQEVVDLEKELDRLVERATKQQLVVTPSNVGAMRETFERENKEAIAALGGDALRQQTERLMNSSIAAVREGGEKIRAQLDSLFTTPLEGDQLLAKFNQIKAEADKFAAVKPIDLVKDEELAAMDTIATKMQRLDQIVQQGSQIADATTQERIQHQYSVAQAAQDRARAEQTAYADEVAAVNKALGAAKEHLALARDQKKAADDLAEAQRQAAAAQQRAPIEARQLAGAQEEAKALEDRLVRLSERGLGSISEKAELMRTQLKAAMQDPETSAEELIGTVKDLEIELDNAIERATKQQQIGFAGAIGQPGVGGERAVLERANQELLARAGAPELEERTRRLMNSADDIVREGATRIKARLDALFDVPGEEPQILAEFKKIRTEIEAFEQIKPPDFITGENVSNLNAAEAKLTQIRAIQTATASELDEQTQNNIAFEEKRAALAIEAAKSADTRTASEKEALAIASDAEKKARLQVKAYADQAKAAEQVGEGVKGVSKQVSAIESIDKKLDSQEAYNTLKSNTKDADALLKSNNVEVRAIAAELKRMGAEAQDAYEKGRSSAQAFKEEQERLRGVTQRVANVYGEDIPSNADRAQVSVWKLGNAVDRLGIRGVGGAIRIADAFRGIPPLAIAGVVAIAGLTAAVVKLAQALFEMGKKAASAFLEFTKGSVESAKAVEVTDIQLGSFLRSQDLGKAYRELLFGLSEDVGLDLTKDFARVIVPLAKDVDEVERAAEIAGTLAHAFQETEDSIANAIKQAAGGHFRPLIERFGLTEFEVHKIEMYQKKAGEFTGVLQGLGEALDFRGLSIEGLADSLQLLEGRFNVLKERIKTTFGEPVADALGRSLNELFDLVEERRETIGQFFESLGETVGGVIEKIAGLLTDIVGDVSDTDIAELGLSFEDLGTQIEEALDNLRDLLSSDDRSVVDVAVDLTDQLVIVSEKLSEILIILDGLNKILSFIPSFEVPGLDKLLGAKTTIQDISNALRAGANAGAPVQAVDDVVALVAKIAAGKADVNDFQQALVGVGESIPGIGSGIAIVESLAGHSADAAREAERLAEAEQRVKDATDESTDATRDLIDERQKLIAKAQDYEELQLKAIDAQAKIDEAEKKFARDRAYQEASIHTRFDRQEIDLETKRSEQRQDLFSKHMQRMLQLTDKLNFDLAQNTLNFDRKEIEDQTKYNDKLEDIERDLTDKKLDIEEKFQERLKDIRAKFDLDAEEAIRRNDAVALLRIRRRMQLELDQAKEQRDREEDNADDSAQKKRDDAKIWLDREVRDRDIAEQQKVDDLRAADEERRNELVKQYNYEFGQIDVEYQRQREAIGVNEQRALDDLDTNFQKRREELDDSLSDEYDIVKAWKDAETDYMRLKLQEQTNIIRQQYQIWRQEGSLFSGFLAERNLAPTIGANGVNLTTSGYGTGGLGDRAFPAGYNPYTGLTYRQHGGFVTSGNIYGINERGAEPFYATRAGIIASREAYLNSPFLAGGPASVDNSRTINADIYASDPTRMDPIQRTLMRHIVTEELLSYGV